MAFSFNNHVAEDNWADFIEGRASAAVAAQIEQHLETGCKMCAEQLAYWQKMLGTLERDRAFAPPADVLQNAFALFERLTPRPSVWAQIAAAIVFDSRQTLVPAGARAVNDMSFNLIYEAAERNISLWCESDASNWQITGQVQPPDMLWSVVAIGDSVSTQVDLNDDGEFRLPNLAPGQYNLAFRGAEQEILVSSVDLNMP